jgi:hypothetical protein
MMKTNASGPASPFQALRTQLLGEFGALSRNDIWVACGLALALAVLSFIRIEATHAASLVNNCIFGADTVSFWRWLEKGNYLAFVVHKHTLAVILTAIIAQPLVWAGIETITAVTIALAAIWGAVAAVVYIYFRRAGLSPLAACAMSLFAFSTLAIATHGGIAETYGATLLMIGIACQLLPAIAKLADSHVWGSAVLAGTIGAGLAIANAPSAAFIFVYFACLPLGKLGNFGASRAAITVAIPALFVSVAVFAPAFVAEGADGARWHANYLARYARFENFIDPATLTDFFVSAFVFAFVAPLEHLQCRFVASDIVELISVPIRLVAYLVTISLVVLGIARAFRNSRRREVMGMAGAIFAILVFYLYFNPDEALLYSPQWVLALLLVASPSFSRAWLWAGIAAVLCFSINLPALHDIRTFDPEVCCPNPPATMRQIETPPSLWQQRIERGGTP